MAYVKATTNEPVLPQLTVKAIALGIVLSAVLAGANAYLGLFAGLTVSASIPAAVISMAVLRLFKESNILENNIVQTAASAGESLAAGVIFTLPFRNSGESSCADRLGVAKMQNGKAAVSKLWSVFLGVIACTPETIFSLDDAWEVNPLCRFSDGD